jgi:hypothetical protein
MSTRQSRRLAWLEYAAFGLLYVALFYVILGAGLIYLIEHLAGHRVAVLRWAYLASVLYIVVMMFCTWAYSTLRGR